VAKRQFVDDLSLQMSHRESANGHISLADPEINCSDKDGKLLVRPLYIDRGAALTLNCTARKSVSGDDEQMLLTTDEQEVILLAEGSNVKSAATKSCFRLTSQDIGNPSGFGIDEPVPFVRPVCGRKKNEY